MYMYMGLGILIVKHGVLKVYEPCLVDCFQEVSIHSPQGSPPDLYLTNTKHYIKNWLCCELTRQWFKHYVHNFDHGIMYIYYIIAYFYFQLQKVLEDVRDKAAQKTLCDAYNQFKIT